MPPRLYMPERSKQQARRLPEASMSQAVAMRLARVSAFLPDVTQWIQSRRATGVMSFHVANAAGGVKRAAGIKGDIDHFGALGFLQGLLLILRDSGYSGLVLVLDEVETLQRVRGDVREKSLNALRQFMDEIDAGRFPGLYLMITGTPAFFDGPQGVQRLPPLAQRLHVDFSSDPRFDNPRAVQIRLRPFDMDRLVEVGRNVREVFLQRSQAADRMQSLADDAFSRSLPGRSRENWAARSGWRRGSS